MIIHPRIPRDIPKDVTKNLVVFDVKDLITSTINNKKNVNKNGEFIAIMIMVHGAPTKGGHYSFSVTT